MVALGSSQSRKKLSAEKRRDTHFLRKTENAKWIAEYVDRETTVARKQVQDTDTAIINEQEDMRNDDKAGLTTREQEKTFDEMLNAIGDGLSNLASSDDEEVGEDEEDDEDHSGLGKLTEDNKLGWVMNTISKHVQHCMEPFWP